MIESTKNESLLIEPPFGRGLKNRTTYGSKRAFTVFIAGCNELSETRILAQQETRNQTRGFFVDPT